MSMYFSSQNKYDLLEQVDRLPYRGGNTNTTGSLIVAKDLMFSAQGGDRDYAPNVLILLSDGEVTRWLEKLVPYATQLRDQHNIRILGIGVGNAVSIYTFSGIVSPPFEDSYFSVASFDLLQTIVAKLNEEVCPTQALPTTTPSSFGKLTMHSIRTLQYSYKLMLIILYMSSTGSQ